MTIEYKPGELIADRYQVQRMLGRGGMGVVYLVVDTLTQQRLALKTLLPQYITHEYAVKRFMREVNVVRQLNHPCIVKIHEAQQAGSLLYYTMDYVEGKSLHSLIRHRGRLGLGSTVRILSLLCHALEHAHQHTIHRDLSPDNVMVLADGSIKLLDFGLAKLTNDESGLTRVGISLGKLNYMAPEQRANAKEVDHRADIYSLGVMFFQMLSGQLPKINQRLTDLVPNLPTECDQLVEKAMAAAPDARFADAQELRLALAKAYDVGKAMVPPKLAPQVAEPALALTSSPGFWERLKLWLRWPLRK
ncbi:MAG: serine/threonine protein kinase [Candidatus Hydrogenedentes bacterium]|nr:serine/threonine protein kinase [Candidatus Hydrogenedentota bacterium]